MQDSDSNIPPRAPCAPESGPALLHRRPAVPPFSHSANENGAPPRKTPPPPFSLAFPRPPESEALVTVITGPQAGRFAATSGTPMTIGRASDADLVVDDDGVSPHHVRIARAAGKGYYVEDLGSTTGTFLGTVPIGVALLRDGDHLKLGPNVEARFAVVEPVDATPQRIVPSSAGYDPLTGAHNRLALNERLIAEVLYARRAKTDLGALAIDVDNLKDVNDRYGRGAGDSVLRTMVARIRGLLGAEDTLARSGGDEFIVLVVGSAGPDAIDLAERVRGAAEGLHAGRDARITVSIGVASLSELYGSDEPARALLVSARARMHRAQAAGANRVCASDSVPR
jgi:diguanylate cyclase (GGDEF)-like protein